jgi:predicted MFS family arabinose efflux permease
MSHSPVAFWRNSDLKKVLIGETISDLGSEIGDLALPLLAATALNASAGQMATLLGAGYVPRIIVGLAASGWIDRMPRRPVLIATNLARFALLCGVALAAWSQLLSVEAMYGVAILLAGLDVMFTSTFAAYLPSLVPRSTLIAANGARAASSAGASVVGPAVAGGLISLVGPAPAIAADAVSFLASVFGLVLVRTKALGADSANGNAHPLQAIVEGWRTLANDRILRALAATAFTANFFYRVIMSVYIIYLTRNLGLSPTAVGIVFGFGGGIGVLIGSSLAAPVARTFGVGRCMVTAHLLFGVLGLPLALTVFLPVYAAPLVFASEFTQLAVNAVYMVNRTSVEQSLSPDAMRGRIQSSRNVAHAVAGVLGIAVGGLLGSRVDVSAAILVGVIGGLTSFAWLLTGPLRDVQRLPGLESATRAE